MRLSLAANKHDPRQTAINLCLWSGFTNLVFHSSMFHPDGRACYYKSAGHKDRVLLLTRDLDSMEAAGFISQRRREIRRGGYSYHPREYIFSDEIKAVAAEMRKPACERKVIR